MGRLVGALFLAMTSAACTAAVAPTAGVGIITITNDDDEPATVEVALTDPDGAHEEVIESFELSPGEIGAIDMDPSWDSDRFLLRVNDILAVEGSAFGGCGPEIGFTAPHLEIIVRPNGGPDICP